MRRSTISFYTLGCRLNQAETAVIENSFKANGYRVVDFKEPADIVVVNTCTVTENGDADTRRLVYKINRINPQARIALIGCQAQMQKARLAEMPNVRWVVGNARKMELVELLAGHEGDGPAQIITPTIPRQSFTIPMAGIDRRHTRANLKIQDGCDFFCSFCEIPYARGRARSREFDDIIREAEALSGAGHQEVVLTGINVGTYRNQGKTLINVIGALAAIPGLKRIRISSIEPTTIPNEMVFLMQAGGKLCRHLHVPLQSAHDEILTAMKRKYSLEEFSGFLTEVESAVEGICLGTDIIVGFPGEREEHFAATYDYLRESPLHYLHVFSYSARSMAKSRASQGEVPAAVIQRRSQLLRELSRRKRRLFYETRLGKTQEVLFEQKKGRFWVGLTDNYVRVNVESHLDLSRQFRRVKLQKTATDGVIGELAY